MSPSRLKQARGLSSSATESIKANIQDPCSLNNPIMQVMNSPSFHATLTRTGSRLFRGKVRQGRHVKRLQAQFLISHKFQWLHDRVILHAQDELQELEKRLESL